MKENLLRPEKTGSNREVTEKVPFVDSTCSYSVRPTTFKAQVIPQGTHPVAELYHSPILSALAREKVSASCVRQHADKKVGNGKCSNLTSTQRFYG